MTWKKRNGLQYTYKSGSLTEKHFWPLSTSIWYYYGILYYIDGYKKTSDYYSTLFIYTVFFIKRIFLILVHKVSVPSLRTAVFFSFFPSCGSLLKYVFLNTIPSIIAQLCNCCSGHAENMHCCKCTQHKTNMTVIHTFKIFVRCCLKASIPNSLQLFHCIFHYTRYSLPKTIFKLLVFMSIPERVTFEKQASKLWMVLFQESPNSLHKKNGQNCVIYWTHGKKWLL